MSKSGLLPIEQAVKNHLENIFTEAKKLRFVLGVSGGIDSICLLRIFKKLNIQTIVVHINYGIRGEESDKDAAFVEEVCNELGVRLISHKINSTEVDNANFQAWAREVRYEFFDEAAQKTEAAGIAVAHQKDDQIETILQKIFRGSGLAAWSAMEVWDGKLFRPLLQTSRDEIKNYCEEKEISFRVDRSNLESDYARNFLRNDWLPQIEQHFPGWGQNVLRAAEQADIFKLSLDHILENISNDKDGLKREPFLALPLSLQKSLLLTFIEKKGVNGSVSRNALSQLHKLNDLQTGRKLQLNDEFSLVRDRSQFTLINENQNLFEPLSLHQKQLKGKAVNYDGFEFNIQPFHNPDYNHSLYLDVQKLQWPLLIRPWRQGDHIQPLGMSGRQTVADHLTNRKVSAAEKSKTIVVQSFEETVAAVIFPPFKKEALQGTISEKFKCNASTEQCVTITLKS